MIDLPLLLNWAFQTAVAFVSTIAFAIIFHTPRREYLFCGITGGLGWLGYLICMHLGIGVVAASFFATVALAWASRSFAFLRKTPVTVFLITGIFPLVPGAGIYYTMQYAIQGDAARFISRGMHTLGLSGALALGVLLVSTAMRMWLVSRHRARERS